MKKLLLIIAVMMLTGCVVRTKKEYIHIPPNSQGTLVNETEEVIWFWE
jgi:uncharacterized lipoprotein YmbA